MNVLKTAGPHGSAVKSCPGLAGPGTKRPLAACSTSPVGVGRFVRTLGLCVLLVVPVAAAAQSLQVDVENGRLSVTAQDASVKALVEAIARKAGLILEDHESLGGRVTLRFEGFPIAEGLQRVLGDRGYMLVYGAPTATEGNTRVPVRVKFFDRVTDDASSVAPDQTGEADRSALFETLEFDADPWDKQDSIDALVKTEDPAIAQRLGRAALADSDVDVRSAAIDALTILGGAAAVEMLEIALQDADGEIRRQAVGALEKVGGDAALRGLTVALQDTDADLRLLAIDAVGELGGPEALRLLEYAATDPNPLVREGAEDWLAELTGQGW